VIAAAGALALVVLATALTKARPESTVTALVGLGACWTASAWTQGAQTPGGTIFAAAGLLVAAELAFASLEQVSVPDEPELLSRRLAGIVGRGLGALVLAAILLAALGLNAGGGLALEAVGVAAVVGLLLLVFSLARAGTQAAER
jgi:glutamine cyclotransferase